MIDQKYFTSKVRQRRANFYRVLERSIIRNLRKRYLNIEITGENNLPVGSAVLAMHHELGIDGWILASRFYETKGKKMHYLTQKEGYFTCWWNRALASALEEIPVSIDRADVGSYRTAICDSGLWLGKSEDYVGAFIDGPFARIMDLDRNATPLEDRPNYPIATLIARKNNKPIVPIAEWCDADSRRNLAFWWLAGGLRTLWRNIRYMERKKPIRYKVAIGTALNPEEYSLKELTERVRLEQITLRESIRED